MSYKIKIPKTIDMMFEIYYRLRVWNRDGDVPATYCERFGNYCHFIWLLLFLISVATGAYTTSDKDECVFLIVIAVAYFVLAYRMVFIIWRKNELLSLIHRIGTQCTESQSVFLRNSSRLNRFMKFFRCFVVMLIIGASPSSFVYPIVSEKHLLLFNIALPFDRSGPSKIGFWMAYVFVIGGSLKAVVCVFFILFVWHLMVSLSIAYTLLGNQFQQLGDIGRSGRSELNVSKTEQLGLFEEKLSVAMKNYERINGILKDFENYLGNLFLLQVLTGSVCMCGGVYALAFSSHDDLVKDGYSCAFLSYSIFDIIMIMYLGNGIKVSSDELSSRLYESNWIQQSQSCKRKVIIMSERLKQPQELVVGKIFPMNLETLSKIMRATYSIFNVLLNLHT